MFRLQALGGLSFSDASGAPVPLQRRRLALLALIATNTDAGISRDKVVACLWPESSPENARHALEQLLYSLKRQFAPEALIGGVDPLSLTGAVESDVQAFAKALDRGAFSEAAALYRGPFLDGFFLNETGFEEWAEGQRQRLARLYAETLQRLARAASIERHHTEAIAWWSRLATHEPFSERAALGLARALADAGDAASAIREAEAYTARADQELGVASTPEYVEFISRLRQSGDAAPAPAPAQSSSGRYRIEREIGRGAVAIVYLARDLRHERRVAIKVLRPELRGSIEVERFLREISIAASLYHPHIVQLYDSGIDAGIEDHKGVYYVMPFVEGESLRDAIAHDVAIPLDAAVRIAIDVADALGYAHERGIVHRDVKPENILLDHGHALLTDFGVGRALETAGGDSLSQSGIILGTPAYMSPEQALGGKSADRRSDLYALGCVLYELLAGQPPFSGRTAQSILARHASDPVPPLRTVRPDLSRRLEGVVLRLLEKNPANRFQTAAAVREALAEVLVDRDSRLTPA